MANILSSTFQVLANNSYANKMAKKHGLKFGAKRFVAGNEIGQAVETIQMLNNQNMGGIFNYLGEFVTSAKDAEEATINCIKTLEAIHENKLDANLTLKITSLGLGVSKELCLKNLREILSKAEQYNIFVRIEMEDYYHCQLTLDIFKELKTEYSNIGTVIQAYLFRTEQDIEDLNEYNANLRLVKGAYKESSEVAYPKKSDVDQNYEDIIKTHLINGNYAAIASHDDKIIDMVIKFTEDNHISKDKFEFQMLFGIRLDLQNKLVDMGYRVQVYVPYGDDWFGYFMRRLAERPENVTFVVKSLFKDTLPNDSKGYVKIIAPVVIIGTACLCLKSNRRKK